MKKMRPPLLDVLLPGLGDEEAPRGQTREFSTPGLWTDGQFVESVKRDLYYLFNSVRITPDENSDIPERVLRSVLFYGFPNY